MSRGCEFIYLQAHADYRSGKATQFLYKALGYEVVADDGAEYAWMIRMIEGVAMLCFNMKEIDLASSRAFVNLFGSLLHRTSVDCRTALFPCLSKVVPGCIVVGTIWAMMVLVKGSSLVEPIQN